MKSVLKILIAVVVFTIAQSAIHAQHEDHPREKEPKEMVEKRTEKLAEKLDLTEEQTEKVKALNLRQAEEMKALHEELRLRREALREESKAEMKQILTAEQYAEFEELMAARKDKMKGKRKGLRGDRGKKNGREKN